MTKTITYVYKGLIERPSGLSYAWRQGYSRGGNTFPWLTRREARLEAEREGSRAVFTSEGRDPTPEGTGTCE